MQYRDNRGQQLSKCIYLYGVFHLLYILNYIYHYSFHYALFSFSSLNLSFFSLLPMGSLCVSVILRFRFFQIVLSFLFYCLSLLHFSSCLFPSFPLKSSTFLDEYLFLVELLYPILLQLNLNTSLTQIALYLSYNIYKSSY